MSAPDGGHDVTSLLALRVITALLVGLSVLLVLPFLQALLAAGLLAYLLAPLADRLSARFGRTVGALVTMLVAVLVVLVPIAVVLAVAAQQATALLGGATLPDQAAIESMLSDLVGQDVSVSALRDPLTSALQSGASGLAGSLAGVLGGIPGFVVATVVFLFTLYSLLRSGDTLVAWLRRVVPLDPPVADELLSRADNMLWAAVVGNVIVAAVQAVLTLLAFVVIGFDNIVFWGVVTFGLSLLPIIGASVVWIPAVGYLLFVGAIPQAAGLFVFGAVVISGSDNIVRPLAMRRGAELDTGSLVLGIFGGVALFGFIGLFVGPVVLGLAKATVDLLVAERDRAE